MNIESFRDDSLQSNKICRAGNFIFTGGIYGTTPEKDGPVDGGAYDQTIAALNNLDKLLDKAGASLLETVKITFYLRHYQDYDAVVKAVSFMTMSPHCVVNYVFTSAMLDPRFSVQLEAVAVV